MPDNLFAHRRSPRRGGRRRHLGNALAIGAIIVGWAVVLVRRWREPHRAAAPRAARRCCRPGAVLRRSLGLAVASLRRRRRAARRRRLSVASLVALRRAAVRVPGRPAAQRATRAPARSSELRRRAEPRAAARCATRSPTRSATRRCARLLAPGPSATSTRDGRPVELPDGAACTRRSSATASAIAAIVHDPALRRGARAGRRRRRRRRAGARERAPGGRAARARRRAAGVARAS